MKPVSAAVPWCPRSGYSVEAQPVTTTAEPQPYHHTARPTYTVSPRSREGNGVEQGGEPLRVGSRFARPGSDYCDRKSDPS